MAVTPPTGEVPVGYTDLDIITDALIETGAVAPGEAPEPEVGQWAFRRLNDLLDEWGCQRKYVYSTSFELFTLVPGLSPHTIGPAAGATFSVPVRPVRLESAALILNTGTGQGAQIVDLPINIRDATWWALNQVKAIETNVPTDVFYSPDWPNCSLFFWPVPNQQQQVRLQLWNQVYQADQITDPIGGLNTALFQLPPGYRAAVTSTLAEQLCPGLSKEPSPQLIEKARRQRVAVLGNNEKSPRISTQDFGMPKTGGKGGYFNWASGDFGPPSSTGGGV